MSVEASQVFGLSGRYSVSLFELAEQNSVLETVTKDLESIDSIINASSEFSEVVQSSVIARHVKASAVAAVVTQAGVSDLVKRFIGVVGANGRLNILSKIIRDFKSLMAAHRREVTVQVSSAVEITSGEIERLRLTLSEKFSHKFVIESYIDPSLLGGVVVRLGSRMYDSSVRSGLKSIKLAMKGVG